MDEKPAKRPIIVVEKASNNLTFTQKIEALLMGLTAMLLVEIIIQHKNTTKEGVTENV